MLSIFTGFMSHDDASTPGDLQHDFPSQIGNQLVMFQAINPHPVLWGPRGPRTEQNGCIT